MVALLTAAVLGAQMAVRRSSADWGQRDQGTRRTPQLQKEVLTLLLFVV
jgi:hypothetical protein